MQPSVYCVLINGTAHPDHVAVPPIPIHAERAGFSRWQSMACLSFRAPRHSTVNAVRAPSGQAEPPLFTSHLISDTPPPSPSHHPAAFRISRQARAVSSPHLVSSMLRALSVLFSSVFSVHYTSSISTQGPLSRWLALSCSPTPRLPLHPCFPPSQFLLNPNNLFPLLSRFHLTQ